ncbi:hypothetical protein PINS_up014518 [Pythium insidiosum]|nr:hypothetical protein PINS_up014518 [Pythium insidiosum]
MMRSSAPQIEESPKREARSAPSRWVHRVGYVGVKLALAVVLLTVLPPPSSTWKHEDRLEEEGGGIEDFSVFVGCISVVTTAVFLLVQGSDPGYLDEGTYYCASKNFAWRSSMLSSSSQDVMRRSAIQSTEEDAQLLTTEEEEDGELELEPQNLEMGLTSSTRSPAQRKDAERNYRLWRVQQLEAALQRMGTTDDDAREGNGKGDKQQQDPPNSKSPSLCEDCGIFPPLRSHHCRACGRCVAMFDHHCFVLGTCVGERNHGRFWWYLLVQSVEICVGLTVTWSRFRPATATASWAQRNGLAIMTAVVLTLLLLFVGSLLVFHTFLAMTSMTTFEFGHGSERIEYLRGFQIRVQPTPSSIVFC